MPLKAKVGAAKGVPGNPRLFQNTTSGYGATQGTSVGYNALNPQAYSASRGAKAYPNTKAFDANAAISSTIGDFKEPAS